MTLIRIREMVTLIGELVMHFLIIGWYAAYFVLRNNCRVTRMMTLRFVLRQFSCCESMPSCCR